MNLLGVAKVLAIPHRSISYTNHMSITFWAPDAPTKMVTPYPDSSPEYQEEQSTLPELKVGNGNALAFLGLLGITPDHCGTIELVEMPALLQRLLKLVNDPSARSPILVPPSTHQSVRLECEGTVVAVQRNAYIISGGLGDHQVLHYATKLSQLLREAQQLGCIVSWG